MSYNNISYQERSEIDRLFSLGYNMRSIAREVHRAPSSILPSLKKETT